MRRAIVCWIACLACAPSPDLEITAPEGIRWIAVYNDETVSAPQGASALIDAERGASIPLSFLAGKPLQIAGWREETLAPFFAKARRLRCSSRRSNLRPVVKRRCRFPIGRARS